MPVKLTSADENGNERGALLFEPCRTEARRGCAALDAHARWRMALIVRVRSVRDGKLA